MPLRKRALYDSSLGAVFSAASVVAPLIGGAFTTRVSWRWCFWINLPCGAVGAAAIWYFVNLDQGHALHHLSLSEKLARFDFSGALLCMASVVPLLLALQWAGTKCAWNSPTVIVLLAVSAALTICFCLWQHHLQERALLPPRILKLRSVQFSLVIILVGGSAVTIAEYYVSSLLSLCPTIRLLTL